MRAAWIIFLKDLRVRVRDRSVFVFALVVPLALTVVFSLLFPDLEDFELSAAVLDLDGGEVARGFTDGVLPALEDAGVLDRHTLDDEQAIRAAMDDGRIAAAWIIPAGFTDDVLAGRRANLRVLVNPDRRFTAEVARSVADGFARRIDTASLAVATSAVALGGEVDAADLQRAAQLAATAPPAIAMEDIVAPSRQVDPVSYLAAGMAVLFVFFTVQYGATGMLEERQQGTLPRLLAAPIPVAAIHAGKALGAFAVGLVSMAVLANGSALLLGASWGPSAGVAVLVVSAVVAAVGVMAFVGTFARTAEQAGNLQSIVAIVLGLLGGVFFPLPAGFLGQLTLASPHGWFLRGLGDLAGAGSWTATLPAAGAMVAFGVVAAIPTVLRLRRLQP